jgi:hypothetical protein
MRGIILATCKQCGGNRRDPSSIIYHPWKPCPTCLGSGKACNATDPKSQRTYKKWARKSVARFYLERLAPSCEFFQLQVASPENYNEEENPWETVVVFLTYEYAYYRYLQMREGEELVRLVAPFGWGESWKVLH